MRRIPLPTQTLYAELLEQLIVYETHRSIGHVSGSFVTKAKTKTIITFNIPSPADKVAFDLL